MTSPGLSSAVQVTLVEVAVVTEQALLSMRMRYLEMSSEKPVPEKVTEVPPVTGPNLGLIADRRGVFVPVKVTDCGSV